MLEEIMHEECKKQPTIYKYWLSSPYDNTPCEP